MFTEISLIENTDWDSFQKYFSSFFLNWKLHKNIQKFFRGNYWKVFSENSSKLISNILNPTINIFSILRSYDLTSIQKSCQVALAAYPINILNIFYPMIIWLDQYSETMSSRPSSLSYKYIEYLLSYDHTLWWLFRIHVF